MPWTLVTGGAKNLGASICQSLASEGFDLIIHYRSSESEAKKLAENCRSFNVKAEILYGDFSTGNALKRFIASALESFPDLVHLINNVGNYCVGTALDSSLEQWHDLFQTNVFAPVELIRAFIPSIKINQGSIVNIGTVGLLGERAETYHTSYFTSKQSLWTLTRSFAKEFAAFGVRVNMVSPGYLENSIDLPKNPQSLPMGRAAEMKEIAEVVKYFLSADSKYITGQNIEVAGGVRL